MIHTQGLLALEAKVASDDKPKTADELCGERMVFNDETGECEPECESGYLLNEFGKCVDATYMIILPVSPIADMVRYLECFNTSKNTTITIYADQPKMDQVMHMH